MDTINYVYNGTLWRASSTISDKNSFFHAAFGVRANEDEPYLDKKIKFRRSHWVTFLSYFEDEPMSPRLTDLLNKCLSAIEKYKHVSVEDQDRFEDYVLDITNARHDVTIEEISILAALDNMKVILFNGEEAEPAAIISPDIEVLGTYPYTEKPKREVVLLMEGNIFSRMNSLVEDPISKSTGNEDNIAGVKTTEGNVEQSGSGLIRYKKGGSAGSGGIQFQVGLLSVFFLNALQKLKNWRLSTENTTAGKFDDVVMESPEGATLLQAKYKQNNKKKITFEELFSTNSKNDDFSIPKYFFSFEKIKKTFKLKELIICTNVDVEEKAMEFLKCQNVNTKSLLHYENPDCKFYTFSNEILPHLMDNVKSYFQKNPRNIEVDDSTITHENIKYFLGHLQLFFNYPPGNDIGKVTEQLLSHMKLSENLYINILPSDIDTKIRYWLEQKDNVCITELYAKAIFSEIWRDKHWQRLKDYKINFQCNSLNLQNSKSLFHLTVEGGYLLYELKIFCALQSNKMKEILFVGSDDDAKKLKLVVEAFGLPQYTILILVWQMVTEERVIQEVSCKLREILDKFRYKRVVLIAGCNNKVPQLVGLSCDVKDPNNKARTTLADLSKDSREVLLDKENIIFQGNDISLRQLLTLQATEDYAKFLNTEELEKLIRGERIKVGTPVLELDESKMQSFYIKREFKKQIKNNKDKNAKSTGEDIFSEELICDIKKKIVLISDSAGTGKSTVLTNLATTMKKKYPLLWIIRIDLNAYTQILNEFFEQNRESINILELLNSKRLTKFTNQLEWAVFSIKEKVVLLLDGFDEISPDYTKLVLNLLSFCREAQNFAKVIVTTRPHMARELEETLQVEPFILEPFTEQNQIHFLVGFWMRNLIVDDTKREKCEEYAKALIKKMSSWLQLFEHAAKHFAAIPLHVRMLAEIFQGNNEISDGHKGCMEYLATGGVELQLPKNMDVTKLYNTFIQKKQMVFIKKGNKKGNIFARQALKEQFKAYHKSLALELILDQTQCELFCCGQQAAKALEMNVLDTGIIQKVNKEFHFAHRTFAEYFVAESLMEELLLPNENVKFQKLLIEEILLESQFIIHVFFNSFLQQAIDDLFPQRVSYKITSFDEQKFFILENILRNGQLAIFQLILECVDLSFFAKIPNNTVQYFEAPPGKSIPKYCNILNIMQLQALGYPVAFDTFLESAVRGGHLEMVKFLVHQGANVNIGRCRPLHVAIDLGHFEMAKFLVDQGAEINAKDSYYDNTAVGVAISRNDTVMVTYLLHRALETDGLNINNFIVPYMAAYLGRIDALEELIKRGLDVNVTADNFETIFLGSIRGEQLKTIRYLVHQGYDINSTNYMNNTALHVISSSRYASRVSIAELLVELGVDVNAKNMFSMTALHIAVMENNFDLVKLLVNSGANVNLGNVREETALHMATERNKFDMVELLVNRGADVNSVDLDGNTALHIAAKNLRGDTMKLLVKHGANVNSKNRDDCLALHLAMKNNTSSLVHNKSFYCSQNVDLIKFLLEITRDVNTKNSDGFTVCHLAVESGQLDNLILLKESGVDVNITDNCGRTALHLAALKDYRHFVKLLVLQQNADSNIRDISGQTVLHYLVGCSPRDDECDVLRLVIESGGDVSAKDSTGGTALHIAVKKGHFKTAEYLVELGVDINIRNNRGYTALHLAVTGKDSDTTDNSSQCSQNSDTYSQDCNNICWGVTEKSLRFMKTLLIKFREAVDVKDGSGRTALHLAILEGHLKVVELLVQHGADINYRDVCGRTALHTAACEGHVEIINILLERGIDVNIRDNDGRTPLHLAVEKNAFNVVTFLVKSGADVDVRDDTGSTTLHTAASKGYLYTTKYLVQAGVDVSIRNTHGHTALHAVVIGRDLDTADSSAWYQIRKKRFILDIVETLLTKCREVVNVKDEWGRTALHLAVLLDYLDVVKVLVQHDADFNIKDNSGRTAVQLAVEGDKRDITKLLVESSAKIN